MKNLLLSIVCAVALLAAGGVATAAPPGDRFTGVWVLDDGDGSTSYWIFGAAGSDGVRRVTVFDTYATFCEVGGEPGSGASLVAHGTAVDDGTTISMTIASFNCANGAPGAVPPPLQLIATFTAAGLAFADGFVATRPGDR